MPKLLEQIIWVRLKTCFPFESLEFGHLPDRQWLRDRPPVKTLGTESLINFIHVCLQHITGVIKCILWTPLGKELWKFSPIFTQTLPYETFPLPIMLGVLSL